MDISILLRMQLSILNQEQSRLEKKLKQMPAESIVFQKNGKRFRWVEIKTLKEGITQKKYLKRREPERAERLAEKHFLQACISSLETQRVMIHDFLTVYPTWPRYPDHLPESCPDYRKLLSHRYEGYLQRKTAWETESFEKCADYPERLIVPTVAGINVRSKSEAMIADALWETGIPFHYEEAFIIGDMKLYPDFTILNPDPAGKPILWEHFGMMDAENYAKSAAMKLTAYMEAGYLPGGNLITTYESKSRPLDITYIKLMIAYFFSPEYSQY